MSDFLIGISIVLLAALGVISIITLLVLNKSSKESAVQKTLISVLQQQVEGIRCQQETLNQSLEKSLRSGQENISSFLSSSQRTFGELKEQIGKLKGDSEHLLQIGADIRTLQNILKAPKLRGQMGEFSLASLLGRILPADSFSLQHSFANGKIVDAMIRLPDFAVSVDAKFPLSAFEQMMAAADENEKVRLRRVFQADVTRHIDKIAQSYILPEEGTLDFALMYIPAENVYYETIIKCDGDRADLLEHAMNRKVIPVSPNLLYAYLMTIVMGLHGMQIEKEAAAIRVNLQKLTSGLEGFVCDWDVLGRHMRNAQGKYDEGQSKLMQFKMQIENIQNHSPELESQP
ncbi:MAG: DNA recombination protein RmuC [Planctomycetaceae bacterium]|nr:DNA recombination protein RmuC [Planctomycetaceae bacterium]